MWAMNIESWFQIEIIKECIDEIEIMRVLYTMKAFLYHTYDQVSKTNLVLGVGFGAPCTRCCKTEGLVLLWFDADKWI